MSPRLLQKPCKKPHTPMPSSPSTPTRRRKSSNGPVDLSFTSATSQSNLYRAKPPSSSRRSSPCSLASPFTPRPVSSHDRSGYFESSNGFDDQVDPLSSNSLGNLADELAEVFDGEDENERELEDPVPETLYARAKAIGHDQSKENEHAISRDSNQKGHAISTSPVRHPTPDFSLSPPIQSIRSRHTRTNSQYDASDYGDDSGLEDTHTISPSLEARLAAVESLVRRGTEANSSDADEIVQRVADSLKDLGSQARVENGATR